MFTLVGIFYSFPPFFFSSFSFLISCPFSPQSSIFFSTPCHHIHPTAQSPHSPTLPTQILPTPTHRLSLPPYIDLASPNCHRPTLPALTQALSHKPPMLCCGCQNRVVVVAVGGGGYGHWWRLPWCLFVFLLFFILYNYYVIYVIVLCYLSYFIVLKVKIKPPMLSIL